MNRNDSLEGRWLTPDPAGLGAVDPANPQSWNAYAYALNNPTTLSDPSGLCPPCRFKVPMPLPSPGIDEFSYAYPDVLGPEGWQGSALSFGGFAFATSWGNGGFGRGGGFIGGGILDTPLNLAPLGPQPNNGEPASACELANIAAVNAVSRVAHTLVFMYAPQACSAIRNESE